jgi:hypothetical protein
MRWRIRPRRPQAEMLFHRGVGVFIVEIAQISVKFGWNVAGQLAPVDLFLVCSDGAAFDLEPAIGIDRMGDVGMQFKPSTHRPLNLHAAIFIQPLATVIAEAGTEVILVPAPPASVAELSRRHGEEQSIISFDDFHIADDECVVERERAKGFEASCLWPAQIDANLRKLHDFSCSRDRTRLRPRLNSPEVMVAKNANGYI